MIENVDKLIYKCYYMFVKNINKHLKALGGL